MEIVAVVIFWSYQFHLTLFFHFHDSYFFYLILSAYLFFPYHLDDWQYEMKSYKWLKLCIFGSWQKHQPQCPMWTVTMQTVQSSIWQVVVGVTHRQRETVCCRDEVVFLWWTHALHHSKKSFASFTGQIRGIFFF